MTLMQIPSPQALSAPMLLLTSSDSKVKAKQLTQPIPQLQHWASSVCLLTTENWGGTRKRMLLPIYPNTAQHKVTNSTASDTGTFRTKLLRKRRTYVQVTLSHFPVSEAFCIFPLTSASATAASRSVLVLRTRMAFTEAGILPGCPSPNRSAQKTTLKGTVKWIHIHLES